MTERDITEIRTRLEELRAELVGQAEALPIAEDAEVNDGGVGQHYADDGTNTFLRERNLALRGNAADLLAQVEAALRRLDEGTYGICQNCGREINPERLEALPYTAYCIECASQIQAAGAPPQ